MQRDLAGQVHPQPITGFIKEDSPLLPNPCHFRDYDRSMFPLSLVPRDAPRRCAQMKTGKPHAAASLYRDPTKADSDRGSQKERERGKPATLASAVNPLLWSESGVWQDCEVNPESSAVKWEVNPVKCEVNHEANPESAAVKE